MHVTIERLQMLFLRKPIMTIRFPVRHNFRFQNQTLECNFVASLNECSFVSESFASNFFQFKCEALILERKNIFSREINGPNWPPHR